MNKKYWKDPEEFKRQLQLFNLTELDRMNHAFTDSQNDACRASWGISQSHSMRRCDLSGVEMKKHENYVDFLTTSGVAT